MRVVVFIGYLCFFLLGGGHNFYADTQHNPINPSLSQNLSENHKINFSNKDQSTTLIEDTDTDLEEEYVNGDDFKERGKDKITSGKYYLPVSWYHKGSNLFVLNHNYKSFKTSPPFSGNTSPIYIKNRVLRI